MSVHASATPSNAAKVVSSRLPPSSFALCRPNLPGRANAATCWTYLGIDRSLNTYFPDLVTTSGEQIFKAYWP
jgi:hypothetical protein